MAAAEGIDQLCGNAHAVARAAHTAFEHVAHTQLFGDGAYIHRTALVGERRVAGNHKQGFEARQLGGDVFADGICKIVLLRVAAQIEKRQHGDGRFVGQGQINRGDALGFDVRVSFTPRLFFAPVARDCIFRRGRHSWRSKTLRACGYRQHELVAPARYVDQRLGAQQSAQGRHLHAEVVFCHDQARPDPINQLVFCDDTPRVFHQALQYIKRSRTQVYQSTFIQQLAHSRQDFKAIKSVAVTQISLGTKSYKSTDCALNHLCRAPAPASVDWS